MKRHVNQLIPKTVTAFIGLVTVWSALIVAAENTADPFAQGVKMSVGSSIFDGGLTFFLIRILRIRGGGNEQ